MRKSVNLAAALTTAALSLVMLAGCGGSTNAPANFTFDESTGSFSFTTVKGADTYSIGVSKVLNDTTGKALESINGSATIDIDGKTYYLWSEQSGSASGLADNDGDGTVDGTVVFREFSSSATTVGAVMDMADLPIGHYVVQAIPASSDDVPEPENAVLEFTKGGTLAAPEGFTAEVNDSGNMEITAPSGYYIGCLTETGMPESMKFEVKDGSEVVETITMDDFSYTNTVNGPSKSFTFTNNTVTGTTKLDGSKEYTVTVTAVGDGDTIKDASADAYNASKADAVRFSTEYDTTASGTSDSLGTISVKLGVDASGASVYELTSTINDIVVLRESGAYTASAEAGTYDEKNTFPEGAVLNFTTSKTEFDAAVLDGKSLTVSVSEAGGFPGQQATKNYGLIGSVAVNGESLELAASSGMPGFGGM